MPLSPGARLGPYEVIAPVGAGGMGEVFRARDTRLDRQVAIKVLPAEFAQNAQLKLRFEREAKAISQLSHPNICTLYDVGDGYLVMELLDGETLADRLMKGPLPINEVMKFGAQIADALDRAHKAGIVHRDLKPSNVMLTKSGAKLLDFGLAKESSALTPQGSGLTLQKPLTEEGTVLGTYHYMAPEQLAGEGADARTDIFAFGALMYEMATGRRAFDGKTKTSVITSIVSREPAPISEVQPFTPPALEHLVRKCLSKDPDDRWQSAHDIATQLRWIIDSGSAAGLAAPVLRTRRSRERLAWIAALVVVAAATLFAAVRLHLGETRHTVRFSVPSMGRGYRSAGGPQISRDGTTLYFGAINEAGKSQVFRRRVDETAVTPVDGTENAIAFQLTPDGRSLLTFSGAELRRVNAQGGASEKVAPSLPGTTTINAAGVVLIGAADRLIVRVPLSGGDPQPVTRFAPGEVGHDRPQFLPDGSHFLFIAHVPDSKSGTMNHVLCAGALDSRSITRLRPVTSYVKYASGHLYFVSDGVLTAVPFDARALKFTGEPTVVADNVVYNGRSGAASFDVADDGTVVYQPVAFPAQLTWLDRSGRKLGIVGPKQMAFALFAVTPDHRRLVESVANTKTGVPQLWITDLERATTAARLTFLNAAEINPVVSRDGTTVYYGSDLDGSMHVYSVPIDGGEPPSLLVSAPQGQTPRDVSTDRYLLYGTGQNYAATKLDLWAVPLTGDRKPFPYVTTPGNEFLATISPDGKWCAYISDVTGTRQIYIKPFPGPGPARQMPASNGRLPRWSADGKHLYFSFETRLFESDVTNGVPSEPRLVFELEDATIGAFWPSPDEQKFLVQVIRMAEATAPVEVVTQR